MNEPKKEHRCCFTGHRPEKLDISEYRAKTLLDKIIDQAISDGFTTFISGMSRGIDIWAAEIILEKRKANDSIRLICASPFEGFENSWDLKEQHKYQYILRQADLVKFICPGYSPDCYQIRNRFMVDHSSRVIAAYSGESGGTKNTLKYAIGENVEIINILNL